MKNPCKSYTLNIMSLISLICFAFYGKALIDMFVSPSAGEGIFVAFIYIPASFIFLGWVIVGILIEHTFYKSNPQSFAFNFPYKKIPLKIIYYPLFYLGLIYGSFWGIYSIIGFPLVFLSIYHH